MKPKNKLKAIFKKAATLESQKLKRKKGRHRKTEKLIKLYEGIIK